MKYGKLRNAKEENIIGDHERGKLDDSGFHYDGCAGGPCGCDGGSGGSPRRGDGGDGLWIIVGLIVFFGGVIGLAELTGIPLENWSSGMILFVMFLLFLLVAVIITIYYLLK